MSHSGWMGRVVLFSQVIFGVQRRLLMKFSTGQDPVA